MTHTTKIKLQQDLMKAALKKLDDMETIDRLITPVDPSRSQLMIEDCQKEYTEIMGDLLVILNNIAYG